VRPVSVQNFLLQKGRSLGGLRQEERVDTAERRARHFGIFLKNGCVVVPVKKTPLDKKIRVKNPVFFNVFFMERVIYGEHKGGIPCGMVTS
jgi:hypothetical protein